MRMGGEEGRADCNGRIGFSGQSVRGRARIEWWGGRGKFRVDGSEAIEFLPNKQSRARQALRSDILKPESLLEGQLVRLY
jgi:hypothetical protein